MTETASDTKDQPALFDLSEEEQKMLEFERRWWRYAASKEDAILVQFNMNATRYYQRLNLLLDKPAALQADPSLVRRLLRIRDSRSRARQQQKKRRR